MPGNSGPTRWKRRAIVRLASGARNRWKWTAICTPVSVRSTAKDRLSLVTANAKHIKPAVTVGPAETWKTLSTSMLSPALRHAAVAAGPTEQRCSAVAATLSDSRASARAEEFDPGQL